jgi:cytochrome c peroxidase
MKSLQLLLILVLVSFGSCNQLDSPDQKSPSLPEMVLPTISNSLGVGSFPQPDRNPMTTQGLVLGKKLFFDPRLSKNGKVSCATCHKPALGFSDGTDLAKTGVSSKLLIRHSPPLFNLAWHTTGLFWDGGANDLESLNFGPITHPDEMGSDLNDVIDYLTNHEEYPAMFQQTFGENAISSAFLTRALSQYTRSLISQTSRYDNWKNGKELLTALELKGYEIYKKHCSTCHKEGLFTDLAFHNNGLDSIYSNPPELEGIHLGRFRISFDSLDLGAFKTPTLRNITFTAPYMHDGRFATLEDVLDHYENNIKITNSLSPILFTPIQLSTSERRELIAFLKTLQDDLFIKNHSQEKF